MIPVFVIPRGERYARLLSVQEYEALMSASYQPYLSFESDEIYREVQALCREGKLHEHIAVDHYWMGVFYGQEMIAGTLQYPHCVISWMSPSLGYGLFAGECMGDGVIIGPYSGEVRRAGLQNNYCFHYGVGDFKTPFQIDAQKRGGLTRFINHSASPNVEAIAVIIDGVLHIIIRSIKLIQAGEQLTMNYGSQYWEAKCVSPESLQFSLDPDQLHFKNKDGIRADVIAKPHFSIC